MSETEQNIVDVADEVEEIAAMAEDRAWVQDADAPACHKCGTLMLRNGVCPNCGNKEARNQQEVIPLREPSELSHDLDEEYSAEELAAAKRLERFLEKTERDAATDLHVEGSDSAKIKAQCLAFGRALINFYRDNSARLARQAKRIDEILARDVHESVRLAAGQVRTGLSEGIDRSNHFGTILGNCVRVVENSPPLKRLLHEESSESVRDVLKAWESILKAHKNHGYDHQDTGSTSELSVTIEALEFAANAADDAEQRKAVAAMGRILNGVATLRGMGFETSEIQTAVDDLIGLREKHGDDLMMLGPVIDGGNKEVIRNKRVLAKRRARILEEDQWAMRFLNQFWYRYWRNAFERSLPTDEHETIIGRAIEKIPEVLDAQKDPLDARCLCVEVWAKLCRGQVHEQEHGPQSRVRVREGHVHEALARLIRSATSKPLDVVEIDGVKSDGATAYWTRRRAQESALKIVSPRLTLVPGDRHDSEE